MIVLVVFVLISMCYCCCCGQAQYAAEFDRYIVASALLYFVVHGSLSLLVIHIGSVNKGASDEHEHRETPERKRDLLKEFNETSISRTNQVFE